MSDFRRHTFQITKADFDGYNVRVWFTCMDCGHEMLQLFEMDNFDTHFKEWLDEDGECAEVTA